MRLTLFFEKLARHTLLFTIMAAAATACGGHPISLTPLTLTCRAVVAADGRASTIPVRWSERTTPSERHALATWCATVGPAVVAPEPVLEADTHELTDSLAVVSWNTHVGGGDIGAFVRDLRSGRYSDGRPVRDFVLLLQEVYRDDALVPASVPRGAAVPRRIADAPPSGKRRDIVDEARALRLALAYAPSMRNGPGTRTADREDRGNAILSTLTLSDVAFIELPFERQRRVAVAATVSGRSTSGAEWTLRTASAHLDNLAGPRRLWLFSPPARARQAKHLLRDLGAVLPAVLGADLNTWFGPSERAYAEARRYFPQTPPPDRRPTFVGGLRLDYLFFRMPAWRAPEYRPLEATYGSDHHPLLGWVRVGA